MNQDKTDTASDSEQDLSQAREEQEKWLAVRRDRLAGERRRNLLIVASVGTVALLLVFFLVWKWRSSSTNSEETVAPVVSVRVAKVEKQAIAAPASALGPTVPP